MRTEREMELEGEVIDLRKQVLELEEVSITDPLTKLLNRRGGEKALTRMSQRAIRSETNLSAIMVDIDFFKKVNDELGHKAGDDVLRQVGDGFNDTLRFADAGIRWGGEEILILTDTDQKGAATLAARLRQSLKAVRVADGRPLTASFGVAERNFGRWEGIVSAADSAMYAAKRGGRDRVQLAASPFAEPIALGEE